MEMKEVAKKVKNILSYNRQKKMQTAKPIHRFDLHYLHIIGYGMITTTNKVL